MGDCSLIKLKSKLLLTSLSHKYSCIAAHEVVCSMKSVSWVVYTVRFLRLTRGDVMNTIHKLAFVRRISLEVKAISSKCLSRPDACWKAPMGKLWKACMTVVGQSTLYLSGDENPTIYHSSCFVTLYPAQDPESQIKMLHMCFGIWILYVSSKSSLLILDELSNYSLFQKS